MRSVERYLERNMRYDERPPERQFPLESFLFRDKIGYCQHFSGAMALMLRMSGIPARVVSGFSPGVRDAENRDEYRIRDLDAHSWVEVYFAGIGWVTFDPDAPGRAGSVPGRRLRPLAGAERDADSRRLGGQRRAAARSPRRRDGRAGGRRRGRVGTEDAAHRPGRPGARVAAAFVAWPARCARSGASARREAAEARVRELERALPRLGLPLGPGATLTTVERTLREAAKPAAARYAARLRAHRFARDRSRPARRAPRAGRCAATWAAGACAAGCGPGARFRPAARGFRTALRR